MVGVTDLLDGRALAMADFGNRGALDVVVANQRGPLLLYKNTVTPENRWIEFELEGRASNRSAIGAQVRLFWNGKQQLQEVSGGSGFSAQSERRLHFGVGKASKVDRVEIRWPSGRTQTIESPQLDELHQDHRSRMSRTAAAVNQKAVAAGTANSSLAGRFFSPQNRYLAPLLITSILLVGQVSYGLLESFSRTALAIAVSIVFEVVLGRIVRGSIPHLASAYISGISVGILLRSPEFWPYALCSAIAITSKYAIRWKGQHLWNPSNFAICAMLLLAPEYVAGLSVQWGNNLWPILIVWLLGMAIVHRVGRLHITLTYVVSFIAFALVRAGVTGQPFIGEVAPITGPMYQLFIFFMITDPKTTVKSKRWQSIVVFLVALVEMILRLNEAIYAPFYALAIVGPAAMAVEIWATSRRSATS